MRQKAQPLVYFLIAVVCLAPLRALPEQVKRIDASLLGMPSGSWPLVRPGLHPETYFIPDQIGAIQKLPEPERSTLLKVIRAHEANLSFLRKTSAHFFDRINAGKLHAVPEYTLDAGEALMAVDVENAHSENPLHAHEPVLQALPAATRVVLLTPDVALSKVKKRIQALGLNKRTRIVVTQEASGEGTTRWMRDVLLTTREGSHSVLLASLAHKNYEDISHNDLAYLSRISNAAHRVLRLPIFMRGGNVAIARAGRTVLLVGSDEVKMNQQWFADTFSYSLPPNAVQVILKAATGSDDVIVLPNSRAFYHLDMFVVPIRDGVIGLLSPLDSALLPPTDRQILATARDALLRLGFQIVPIPTTVHRINNFQSAVNIVPFTDRSTGRHRALVPMFPEPQGEDPRDSLNAKVLEAYRQAGIDPIPVEDRFHLRWGNIHCALVPLR